MRKAFILAILTVLMILPTVACGNDEDTGSAVNSSQSATENQTEKATQVSTEEPTEALTEAEIYAPTELPTEATELLTEELTETSSEGASTSPTEAVTPIIITSYTNSISSGGSAFLEMQGLPNTEYDINVYYSSDASEAEGLENKVSDANGYVRWDWQVEPKTKAGTFKIVISGNGQTTETQFTVTE